MDWSKFLSVENVMFLFGAFGWLFFAVMVFLRFIAPRTATTADDDFLARLEWLKINAPMVFAKVKLLHETGQLPSGVDRYAEYLIRLGEAFGASFRTGDAMLPEALKPTAKLIAEGLHAENKLVEGVPMLPPNPTPGPASR
jgi:hypothetical protein